jgi:hypothetical protein
MLFDVGPVALAVMKVSRKINLQREECSANFGEVLRAFSFRASSQLCEFRRRARSHMKDTVRRWFVPHSRELGDNRPLRAWKCGNVTLGRNFLQISRNQPSMAATLDPRFVHVRREARMWCINMHQPSHD